MARPKQGNATYTNTKVIRQILNPKRWEKDQQHWLTVATYDDALVRDQGESGFLRIPEVMLRAYSNDLNFYGDEDYQQGNGIHVQTVAEAKRHAEYYESKKVEQFVMDCDGDIALKRVMGYLLKKHDWGGGNQSLIVLVSYEDKGVWGSGTRDVNDWTGSGDDANVRIEQWEIRMKGDE